MILAAATANKGLSLLCSCGVLVKYFCDDSNLIAKFWRLGH